ncbi:MAG: uroporphyrinogen-III synthase [Wenzhouxiangella sp.]|nr:MAG: uroporphyrinogen-III synthase [Wenzhouxiangella sp.]
MKYPDLVLVTRTLPAGNVLKDRLLEAGWPACDACPLRLAGPENPEQLRAAFAALESPDRIVLTSVEGLRRAVDLLGVEALSTCPVIVPGPGSRAAGLALGLRRIHCPTSAGNSEAMLALPQLSDVRGLQILIMAAAGGRQLLASELRARGAQVSILHVYRRLSRPLPEETLSRLARAQNPVTMLASAGALQGLQHQLPDLIWQRLLAGVMVAPSPRVADLATELGCPRVLLADGADDEAMARALEACRN